MQSDESKSTCKKADDTAFTDDEFKALEDECDKDPVERTAAGFTWIDDRNRTSTRSFPDFAPPRTYTPGSDGKLIETHEPVRHFQLHCQR